MTGAHLFADGGVLDATALSDPRVSKSVFAVALTLRGESVDGGSRCVGCGRMWADDVLPHLYGIMEVYQADEPHSLSMLFCRDCAARSNLFDLLEGVVKDICGSDNPKFIGFVTDGRV